MATDAERHLTELGWVISSPIVIHSLVLKEKRSHEELEEEEIGLINVWHFSRSLLPAQSGDKHFYVRSFGLLCSRPDWSSFSAPS